MQDRNFDDLCERFRNRIYRDPKGEIRLRLLQHHLRETLGEAQRPWRILDAGCGLGQMALWLARQGHEVVLCDLSSRMLAQARAGFEAEGLAARAGFYHLALQDPAMQQLGRFDLVLCHAVLEWLAQPRAALPHLAALLAPGGRLSLMFYNRHAIVWRNVLLGNFRKVMSGRFAGVPGGLTPINPLDPQAVEAWLAEAGLVLKARAGIRVFYDYLGQDLQARRSLDDVLELERQHYTREPYWRLGRYVHYLCGLARETVENGETGHVGADTRTQ